MVGALRGQTFEAYAHRLLLRGGTFKTRKLSAPGEEELELPTSNLKLWKESSPYTELLENTIEGPCYLKPMNKNSGAIDSLTIHRNDNEEFVVGFQMTCNKTGHPIKRHLLVNVLKALPTSKFPRKFRLYFVLPPDVYDSSSAYFVEQIFHTEKGQETQNVLKEIEDRVEQWALRVPV